ncbi:MAG: redoxin domain-containing protein [Alphaproteobacteria bacterium]|nr:redoxin domain-containing protein [Alphaproteobacteria bacterium]
MNPLALARALPEPVKRAIKARVYPPLLAEGETVPEWHLQSWDGSWHRHNNRKWTVMVFYPGDDTPGCTRQLAELQERYPRFQELGAQVYGVNPAEAPSHQAFAEKLGLAFPLLTDRGGVVARNFKAAVQLPMRTLVLRTVYLVNPERRIRMANRGAPPADAILRSIEALQQATRAGM